MNIQKFKNSNHFNVVTNNVVNPDPPATKLSDINFRLAI